MDYLCYLLGARRKLSTAFRLQTDGQTERQNQTLERYLHCYINLEQDNWAQRLPMAQFTYNATVHSPAQYSPFYAMKRFYSQFPNDLLNIVGSKSREGKEHIEDMHEVRNLMKKSLDVRKMQKKY